MANKILDVLEAVAIHGPATLDMITEKLPRTRSSVYRALIELEKNGWIRRLLNGREFCVSSKMEDLSDHQFNSSNDVTEVINTLRSSVLRCHVMIIVHIKGSDFSVVDSNSYPASSMVECPYMLIALITLMSAMRKYGRIFGPRMENLTESPQSEKAIMAELEQKGFIMAESIETSLMPLQTASGELVFITCGHKNFSGAGLSFIEEMANNVYMAVSGLGVRTFKKSDDVERIPA